MTEVLQTDAMNMVVPSMPDLSATSDTGMSDEDNVTSKMSPTFTGTGDPNSTVRLFNTDLSGATTQLAYRARTTEESGAMPRHCCCTTCQT